jgi:hypothetical protein
MDDDPDMMLRESWLYYLLFWLAVLSLVFLSACTVQHEIPIADKIVDKIAALTPPVQCRRLELPPVPADVVLDIKGDKITANAGGETVLRGYVACRSLYKDAS